MTWAQFPLWMVGSPPAHNGGASAEHPFNMPSRASGAREHRLLHTGFDAGSSGQKEEARQGHARDVHSEVKVTLASTAVDVEREEQDAQEQAADEPCSGCVHIQEPRREDHGRTPFFVGLRIRVDPEVNRKNEE